MIFGVRSYCYYPSSRGADLYVSVYILGGALAGGIIMYLQLRGLGE